MPCGLVFVATVQNHYADPCGNALISGTSVMHYCHTGHSAYHNGIKVEGWCCTRKVWLLSACVYLVNITC